MNSVLAEVVWLFQRAPLSCARAVGRVPGIRTLANRLSPDRVEVASLDDYFGSAGRPIGFVKVDIEDAETLALQGMSRTLQEDGPCLLIELHGGEACTEEHPALLKLREARYTVSRLGGPGESVHVLAKPKHTGAYLQ